MSARVRGLSVLEVIVAIAVLAIAGLGIIATLTRVMVAQSSSSHETVGRLIAESKLQRAVLSGAPSWGIRDQSGDPVNWASGSGDVSDTEVETALVGQNGELTEYRWKIEVTQVSNQNEAGNGMFGIDDDPTLDNLGVLWEVKVQVWWNSESGPEGAIERGTQELTVSRVIYIEE